MGGAFSAAGRDAAREAREGMTGAASEIRGGMEATSRNLVFASQNASLGIAGFGSQLRQGTEAMSSSLRHASFAHERSVLAVGRSVERATGQASGDLLLASRDAFARVETSTAILAQSHVAASNNMGHHIESMGSEFRRGFQHLEFGLRDSAREISTSATEVRHAIQHLGNQTVSASAEISIGHQKAAETVSSAFQHFSDRLHFSVFCAALASCFLGICGLAAAALYAEPKNIELVSVKILLPVFFIVFSAVLLYFANQTPPKFHDMESVRNDLFKKEF